MSNQELCRATSDSDITTYARLSGLRLRLSEDGLLKFNSRHSPRFASVEALAFYCRQKLRSLQQPVAG